MVNEDLRWSGADLVYAVDPGKVEDDWADRCSATAPRRPGYVEWNRVCHRYAWCFIKAVKRAGKVLRAQGVVGEDFVAVAIYQGWVMEPSTLSKRHLRRYFPQYLEADRERRRLAAMPASERAALLVPYAAATDPFGVLGWEEVGFLVEQIGAPAVPLLVAEVLRRDPASRRSELGSVGGAASRLLGAMGVASPDVVHALVALMCDPEAHVTARYAASGALSLLGHMDEVAQAVPELPGEVIAMGLAAPYVGRSLGRHQAFSYAPLEQALAAHPDVAPLVADQLAPGRSAPEIEEEELPAAREGLTSSWPFIRRHARAVLDDFADR